MSEVVRIPRDFQSRDVRANRASRIMSEKHELVERAEAEIEYCEALIKRSIHQKRDIRECIEALNTLENDMMNADGETNEPVA